MNQFTIPNDPLASTSFWLVISAWCVFAFLILFRSWEIGSPERKRMSLATLGVLFQGIAYAITWSVRRDGAPLIPSAGHWLEVAIGIMAPLCSWGAVWLVISSMRTLGKQWAIAPRLIEDHVLISTGPYAALRHPIYAGMLGMLVATGLVLTQWPAFLAAIALFALGMEIRMRAEDRLLEERFGDSFREYYRRVPAIFPKLIRESA